MDYELQIVTVPVSDVDQALAFYTDRGRLRSRRRLPPRDRLPRRSTDTPWLRVLGSDRQRAHRATPGSVRATYLAVTDIEAACRELRGRGVEVSGIRHKSPIDTGRVAGNPVPTRSDGTAPASPTSPTRTATPGYSRRSATGRRARAPVRAAKTDGEGRPNRRLPTSRAQFRRPPRPLLNQ